eukprot:TRINITY_DN14294_c0_g1_i1.p1 TRINITY_DN14294_c0_g1~~TRINITY_DN14294_c0_g1_i1.p1  ORF type:complete len:481 (+),score=102.19 TRINITY_DN14294_c0_g1_i1:207-1649(+)
MDSEFEKQLQSLRPGLLQYRTVGRAFGFVLFLSGVGGGVWSVQYLTRPAQVYAKAVGVGASIFSSLGGLWFMLKTYWNDPQVLREKHQEFMRSSFISQYHQLGWENLLKVSGGKSVLSQKLFQEMSILSGFDQIWATYGAYLDHPILSHDLVPVGFLVEKFKQDRLLSPVVSKLGVYGPWLINKLRVDPNHIKYLLMNCNQTVNMKFTELLGAKELWQAGALDTAFLRDKCIYELRSVGWKNFHKSNNTWWLDNGLVNPVEVQFEFAEALWSDIDFDEIISFWKWPISKHPDLVSPPLYKALEKIFSSLDTLQTTYNGKKSEIEKEYTKILVEEEKDLQRRQKEIADKLEEEKQNLLRVYKNTRDSNYQEALRKITASLNQSSENANKSFEKAIRKPKKKHDEKLALLNHNFNFLAKSLENSWKAIHATRGNEFNVAPIELSLLDSPHMLIGPAVTAPTVVSTTVINNFYGNVGEVSPGV